MAGFQHPHGARTGWRHVLAATGYSLAGARVLLVQPAARLECTMAAVALVLFLACGASLPQTLILLALFAACLCVEALNTGLEMVVDRTSPERSDYARDVKDLGSFAVFCTLAVFNGYAAWTLWALLTA